MGGGVDAVFQKGYNPFDQETLNYCFSEEAMKLPRKYNVWVKLEKYIPNVSIEKKIYHYIGKGESLGLDMHDKFNRLYWKYFAKTSWFNEEVFGKIFDSMREIFIERQFLMTKIWAETAKKSRVFVTIPQNVDALKQIFYVKEGEEFF